VSLQAAQTVFGKMSIQRRPAAVTEFAELEQFFANGGDIGGCGLERFAKSNADPVGNFSRPLGEEFSALKRKDGSPQAIEPDRDHRRVGVLGDQFVAASQS